MQKTTNSGAELTRLAAVFIKKHPKRTRLITLTGPLGAGKTTFVQGIAHGLGIRSHVASPTFTLIHEYPIPKSTRVLVHIDLYRIKKIQDLAPLHIMDYLQNPGMLVCIEWADRFPRLWRGFARTHVAIGLHKNNVRRITIQKK